MAPIRRRRDIIDRETLIAEIDELLDDAGTSRRTQGAVLSRLKDALTRGRVEIRRRFESDAVAGGETVRSLAYLVDELIAVIHHIASDKIYPQSRSTKGESICILATGGYGRATLAPFSDIDLMFLLPYKQTPRGEQVVEYMLYTLWDLGLKVGHATRTVDDAIRLSRDDITIRTSVLESRWLLGAKELYEDFRTRFLKQVLANTGPEYVEAKLAERDERHERMGDTRYVLEPNVKEGKGGLRDLNTLFWIAKYLYRVDTATDLVTAGVFTRDDALRFSKARNFLWTVRCHLHYLSGRPEERLTFDVQPTIAQRLGYTDRTSVRGVERFMKHYFLVAKDVGDLTRILCAVLEEQHKKRQTSSVRALFARSAKGRREQTIDGFRLDGGRLTVDAADTFRQAPVKLLGLFHAAQAHDLDIHPNALRLVRQNLNLIDAKLREDAEANRLFLDMLTSAKGPRATLTRLNEAGVFGRFVPDFGRVVAQMQFDMYHVYTVDEHTIRALGILHGIETGELAEDHPISSKVIHELQSRRVLYVAVFLHDIAKGRGGNHSILGAEVAEKLGPRFNLSEWETGTVSWLVRHHLIMSETAFKRDLDDPKAIADFAEAVQSPERLRLLLVLTVADIRAVGPGVWNGWKATLLRDLYWRAMEILTGGSITTQADARIKASKTALAARLADWRADEIAAHLALGYDSYWLAFDVNELERQARLVRAAEAEKLPLCIETATDSENDVTEVIVYTQDHPGLFSRIAGAMALSGATIVDAKIVTLTNGMALDSFTVQDSAGGAFAGQERLRRLRARMDEALTGRLNIRKELATMRRTSTGEARARAFHVAPRVLIDNKVSRQHTVIEVNGRDRPGFLYDVTAALTQLGLQIASAHISTFGERVVDAFYVKDIFGLRVERPEQVERIRTALLAAISEPPAVPAATASAAE